ncbi:MAG: hypothetical protein JW969_12615 [Spirochaetales bacterium]|nr:hypothetical protein [Spirochaetales bacterium]
MKFKSIFLIFNIIISLSFLALFLMPLFFLGSDQFLSFLTNNWFAFIIFILTISVFNVYFLLNWKLFTLLEKEDWESLISFLENEIYANNRINGKYVKILLNTYFMTSNLDKILKLKIYLNEKKPVFIDKFCIPFSIPYLLADKAEEAEKFFGKILSNKKNAHQNWIRWNYALSLLQQNQIESAKKEYVILLDSKLNPILNLLTMYMLNSITGKDTVAREKLDTSKIEFRKIHTSDSFVKLLEKSKTNIEAVILTSVIRDASNWIFDNIEKVPGQKIILN